MAALAGSEFGAFVAFIHLGSVRSMLNLCRMRCYMIDNGISNVLSENKFQKSFGNSRYSCSTPTSTIMKTSRHSYLISIPQNYFYPASSSDKKAKYSKWRRTPDYERSHNIKGRNIIVLLAIESIER